MIIGSRGFRPVHLLACACAFAVLAASGGCMLLGPTGPQPAIRKLNPTSYYNDGQELFFGVDLRAAKLAGPGEFLPILVSLMNKTSEHREITRESFRLELPDGRLLPLASYEEFSDEYGRSRTDVRIGREYYEVLDSRFPNPPYSRLALEFFPVKNAPTVPRDRIGLYTGQFVIGYIYFRLPEPNEGPFRLLLTPVEAEETYVLPIDPFGA